MSVTITTTESVDASMDLQGRPLRDFAQGHECSRYSGKQLSYVALCGETADRAETAATAC
jgi:hypothetical protein